MGRVPSVTRGFPEMSKTPPLHSHLMYHIQYSAGESYNVFTLPIIKATIVCMICAFIKCVRDLRICYLGSQRLRFQVPTDWLSIPLSNKFIIFTNHSFIQEKSAQVSPFHRGILRTEVSPTLHIHSKHGELQCGARLLLQQLLAEKTLHLKAYVTLTVLVRA